MPRGDARRIRNYLCHQVDAARQAGATMVTFRAGDVHDQLGLRNRHPNVCQVLEGGLFHRQADVEFVRYVYRPPSGLGANLEIEFRLSTESGTSRARDVPPVPAGRGRTEYDEIRYSSGESVGKYDPLRRFLSELDGSEWAATFDQVEQVLGFRLPASARKWRPWWANVENGPSQTRAWAAAGWNTRHVNLLDETLEFVRAGPAVSERVEKNSNAPVPAVEDLDLARLLDRAFVHAATIEPERGSRRRSPGVHTAISVCPRRDDAPQPIRIRAVLPVRREDATANLRRLRRDHRQRAGVCRRSRRPCQALGAGWLRAHLSQGLLRERTVHELQSQ